MKVCRAAGEKVQACGRGEPVLCHCCGSFTGDNDGCFCYWCGKKAVDDVFGVSKMVEPQTCSGSKKFCLGAFDGDGYRDLGTSVRDAGLPLASDPEGDLAVAQQDAAITVVERSKAVKNAADATKNLETMQLTGTIEGTKEALNLIARSRDREEVARDSALQAAIAWKNRAEQVWEKADSRLQISKLRVVLAKRKMARAGEGSDEAAEAEAGLPALLSENKLAIVQEAGAILDMHMAAASVAGESNNTVLMKNATAMAAADRRVLGGFDNSSEVRLQAAEALVAAASSSLDMAVNTGEPLRIKSAELQLKTAKQGLQQAADSRTEEGVAMRAVLGGPLPSRRKHESLQVLQDKAAHTSTSTCRKMTEANITARALAIRVEDLASGRTVEEMEADSELVREARRDARREAKRGAKREAEEKKRREAK